LDSKPLVPRGIKQTLLGNYVLDRPTARIRSKSWTAAMEQTILVAIGSLIGTIAGALLALSGIRQQVH